MLSVSPATRVFVALSPVDMRRSFNGLYAEVQTVLKEDPLSGHLFVFTNRLRNRIKIIWFDGQRAVGLREASGAGDIRVAHRRGCQLQSAARAIAIALARSGRHIAAALVSAVANPHFSLDSAFEFRHNQRDERSAGRAGTENRSSRY